MPRDATRPPETTDQGVFSSGPFPLGTPISVPSLCRRDETAAADPTGRTANYESAALLRLGGRSQIRPHDASLPPETNDR